MDDLYESAPAAGFIEEAAFRLINVLRCEDEEQVVAVWVGLLVLLGDDESMQHLFMRAAMGATVKDLCAGLASFAESVQDRETESLSSGPADRFEFLRFLQDHPLLAEKVVMKALGDLGPAVAAVMQDEVDIRVPLCAVLNRMLQMVRCEGSLKDSGSKGLWNQIASFAARDRGAFYDSFRSALDEWLERNKEDDVAGLRDSMRALRDAVGSSSNRFWEIAYLACYRYLLQAASKCRIPRSLAKALGCSTELTYKEWLGSCEDESELRRQLFAYADYLDAEGQSGAAHVRNVVQEHFGKVAVREGKK